VFCKCLRESDTDLDHVDLRCIRGNWFIAGDYRPRNDRFGIGDLWCWQWTASDRARDTATGAYVTHTICTADVAYGSTFAHWSSGNAPLGGMPFAGMGR